MRTALSLLFRAIVLMILFTACGSADTGSLPEKMRAAEEIVWSRFYSPQTDQFYDYLTSYEEGKGLAHLPKPDEVARQYPNDCGYGTGMEDCMISAGIMMTAVLNRYKCDHYAEGPARAEAVFRGIERSIQSVPGEGFVARGFSPFAPGLFYIGSSRDQVTHAVAALWEYYRSGLPSEEVRERIRRSVKDVADRMRRNVTPENGYDFLRADGSPCPRGICKMENVMPHEAARLAMIYAAAWEITGEKEYYELWRAKIGGAAAGSLHPVPGTATYGVLQMQDSLAILAEMEPDPEIRRTLCAAAAEASQLVLSRIGRLENEKAVYDLTELAPDWREAGGLVPPYRNVWYHTRERGEILLTLLKDPNGTFPSEAEEFLRSSLDLVDFQRNSSCGVYSLLAAWWMYRARRSAE
ncbi:MAG: hypothetical protein K6E55_06315 [Thermoguttaceae bacterium]|nr:hypothetical protein [Thermoguttaceae bacterium]